MGRYDINGEKRGLDLTIANKSQYCKKKGCVIKERHV